MTDFTLENHGSIYLLQPMHSVAHEHLTERVGEDADWYGFHDRPALVVDHHFITNIIEALLAEGFTVA